MNAWIVYIDDEYDGIRDITTVFFSKDCDAEYVRTSLINHDGYPPSIQVRLSK